jgi:hypothetical protein
VLGQEAFFSNMFGRNYIEYLVEGTTRFKILEVVQNGLPVIMAKVQIYDDEIMT